MNNIFQQINNLSEKYKNYTAENLSKLVKIKSVTPQKNYKLLVMFDNNAEKICDISQFLEIGCFKELKDEYLFNQVKNTEYSIEWPNELDLSSDTLLSI